MSQAKLRSTTQRFGITVKPSLTPFQSATFFCVSFVCRMHMHTPYIAFYIYSDLSATPFNLFASMKASFFSFTADFYTLAIYY
ncbi:MAG: hypothetical protein GKR87_03750 [Kiritimatiellae bacterium]|nr:hypothetical protein [Kiritimatiellia bacterium]